VNPKAWVLFAATSVIWGSSFLFIRVAVADMSPSVVVFGRCALGALFLVPLAAKSGALAGMRRYIVPIATVACLDMALPTFLTVLSSIVFAAPAALALPGHVPSGGSLLALAALGKRADGYTKVLPHP
jgi:drug/metabolite transporter (DMT)-like permease